MKEYNFRNVAKLSLFLYLRHSVLFDVQARSKLGSTKFEMNLINIMHIS